MKRAIVALALGLVMPSCTTRDPVAALPAPGHETASPPVDQAERVRAAVAVWSTDRFIALTPRWFVLPRGVPPMAVMKRADTALGDKARRITETGPSGDVALYGWRLKSGDGVVAAVTVERDAAPLAAFFPIRISRRWREAR